MKTRFLLLVILFYVCATATRTIANESVSTSVVFVLDESGSISAANFVLETQGFRNALSYLATDGSIQVSVLGFASSTEIIVEREVLTTSNYLDIDAALENNPQAGGGTYMSGAINQASSILNNSFASSRIICMATDGYPNSTNATVTAAESAKDSGIILIMIGIGLDTSGKLFLDSIASNAPVPNPSNFEEFGEVVADICGYSLLGDDDDTGDDSSPIDIAINNALSDSDDQVDPFGCSHNTQVESSFDPLFVFILLIVFLRTFRKTF